MQKFRITYKNPDKVVIRAYGIFTALPFVRMSTIELMIPERLIIV
jgi:hypothetical protein